MQTPLHSTSKSTPHTHIKQSLCDGFGEAFWCCRLSPGHQLCTTHLQVRRDIGLLPALHSQLILGSISWQLDRELKTNRGRAQGSQAVLALSITLSTFCAASGRWPREAWIYSVDFHWISMEKSFSKEPKALLYDCEAGVMSPYVPWIKCYSQAVNDFLGADLRSE